MLEARMKMKNKVPEEETISDQKDDSSSVSSNEEWPEGDK